MRATRKQPSYDYEDEDEQGLWVPWAQRYGDMQKLRRELGEHGLTQAFKCAMAAYDPDTYLKITKHKLRKRKSP
jgi:hypothetical protein